MADKNQNKTAAPMTTAYREVKIGKTIYRVTSVFLGEKDLGETLEKLAIQKILDEIAAGFESALEPA